MANLSSQAVKMIKSYCKHKFLKTKLNVLPTAIKAGSRSDSSAQQAIIASITVFQRTSQSKQLLFRGEFEILKTQAPN
jgi:hypothetical protein